MDRIDVDLDNQGLTTSPDYRSVPLGETVTVTMVRSDVTDEPAPEGSDDSPKSTPKVVLGVQLKVSRVPSATTLVSVTPQATLDQVITMMLVDDYSQLAVLSGARELRGAVSWKSVAQAKNRDPGATLRDALFPATVVESDDDLLRVLPLVQRDDFVFVRNAQNRVIQGIVTAADVVGLYGEIATPFFLIGEIDHLVRRAISERLDLAEVRALCATPGGHPVESFAKMSMGDYCRTLENPDQWRKLGWALDQTIFVKRLEAVRIIRISVMHFNPDPPSQSDIARISQLLDVLRSYAE